ncbi:hypothetical protein ACB092_07G058200 [Castanea dentata]
MNPISWNCRGLGNPRLVQALHDMTKAKYRRMERIKNRIGLANGLIVPCVGRKGGLAMLWAREIDLEIKSYSPSHIDVVINDTEKSFKWRLTGGGGIWSQKQIDGFSKVVDYCAFQDLGYCGSDFTSCNMQGGENIIYLRLDRAFANLEWTKKFGE